MPDLKSELRKLEAISFDDAGETAKEPNMVYKTTNNVSRSVFNYVKDNPRTLRADVIKSMEELGYNKSSVTSLIGQFLRQNMFKFDGVGPGLSVTQPEYTPLPSNYKKKVKPVAKVTAKSKEVATIEPVPAVNHDTLVKAMLSRMSIIQAREMYDELKLIFER